jgi:hypothetical protein
LRNAASRMPPLQKSGSNRTYGNLRNLYNPPSQSLRRDRFCGY